MRKYVCIQDASTAARSRSIGKLGEEIAEVVLKLNGFTNIRNLNATKHNYQYADVYAEKDGKRFVISVKTRNKYTASEKLNAFYNLVVGGDLAFARFAEKSENAEAAWIAISLEDETFDAYFGLLSSLHNVRSIPMRPRDTNEYFCLAQASPHGKDPLDFKNSYKTQNPLSVVAQNENILGGILVFTGTRVPVKTLFDYLKANHPLDDFLDDFPTVAGSQAQQVLETAFLHLSKVNYEPQI